MDEIVGKRRELIEDYVLRIALQFSALVVDFLDVAFGAGGPNDVIRMGNPLLQPLEPLPAHARGKHSNAAAAENARNRHAAETVISGRRPDRLLSGGVETPRHQ